MEIYCVDTKQTHDIKPNKHGENSMLCPECSHKRGKKNQKCFQWNDTKKTGNCHHCGCRFVESKPLAHIRSDKTYSVPEWKNITELTDKAVAYFTSRFISQDTLKKMQIYSDREWMPQFNKEVNVICFPYFMEGKLTNIKFRGPQKSFKLVKDAELILYNQDCLSLAKDYVIVCEGEIDALSWIEAGYEFAVSVPNGAKNSDGDHIRYLVELTSKIDKIYIASDHDAPGIELRNELIRRLGPERCKIITYKGYKDTNELFIEEHNAGLIEVFNTAKNAPIPGIFNAEDHLDDLLSLLEMGQSKGINTFQDIDEVVRFDTGLFAIWTGVPSMGKSTMLNWLMALWAVNNGWKHAIYSPENGQYQKTMIPAFVSLLTGKKYDKETMCKEDVSNAHRFICDHFNFISDEDTTMDFILKSAESLVKMHGINVLTIDPFNCITRSRYSGDVTDDINMELTKLSQFAKKHNVLVNLVAHPRKVESLGTGYKQPSMYDIAGSANFFNKADIGISVHRYPEDSDYGECTLMDVQKVRFDWYGHPGKIKLGFNTNNRRFHKPFWPQAIDNTNWIDPKDVKLSFSPIENNIEFEDTPF